MTSAIAGAWLLHCIALFFLTFAHEDIAIVAAAFAGIEYNLPTGFALGSVYAGMVVSDLAVYGLGRVARRSRWLRARVIGPRVNDVHAWLEAHLFRVVGLCRLTPGLLFPTFVACGWFRIPFRRFALASVMAGAVYVPIAFGLVSLLGRTVLQQLGYWAWAVMLVLVVALVGRSMRKSSPTRSLTAPRSHPRSQTLGRLRPARERRPWHLGMPRLDKLMQRVSVADRIPQALFYLPVAIRWFWLGLRYRSLSLPSVANPLMWAGGFWGESKSACLDDIGAEHREWIAPYVVLDRTGETDDADLQLARTRMSEAGLAFPVVAKPDVGWQGYGVRLVANESELGEYIADFPRGQRLLIQHTVPYDGEAGVFYARTPGAASGGVFSLTLRYFPYVTGDGESTLRELILHDRRAGWKARYHLGAHPEHLGLGGEDLERVPARDELIRLAFIGSMRVGGLYRDATDLITPAMSERFDAIARSMQEFHFGRFDVRFESLERLQAGEGFSIFEVNGAGSEAIHIWDPERSLRWVYREMFDAQSRMFEIAARNRARGFRPMGSLAFLRAFITQHRLLLRYPPSG